MNRMLSRRIAMLAAATVLSAASVSHAAGWEDIPLQDAVSRSRYIGVGTLTIDGKSDDGWLKGTLTFSQTIYSGIGDAKSMAVRIAPKTEPGKAQNWPSRQKGVWFVFKSGDTYEPVNHPACWMDESKAKAVADQVYGAASKAFDEAKKAASGSTTQSTTGTSSSGDSSDTEKSIAAYAAMAAAAQTMRDTPFQDRAKQNERFFDHVTQMLDTAGVKPPFARDLKDPTSHAPFLDQARQLLGPAGALPPGPPGAAGPSQADQLSAAQHNVGSVYLELIKGTMGSKNPGEAMSKMSPIPLEVPGGKSPGPDAKPPQFQVPAQITQQAPAGGSRRQMLGSMVGGQGKPPANNPGPRPGPTPGGPRPGGPGGAPGGPRPGPGPR